jgi:hypothetical protein
MASIARRASTLALAALAIVLVAAPAARADFGIAKWESLTCTMDESAGGLGGVGGNPCTEASPSEWFFTQAAGHPDFGITDFRLNQTGGFPNRPDGSAKEVRVDLPAGLGVNPEATPQCTVAQLTAFSCPPESQVGTDFLTTLNPGPAPPPLGTEVTIPVPVYNVEPPFGVPSVAGFNVTGEPTLLVGDLDPVDQHISFTISDIDPAVPLIGSRLVFDGKKGEGYLTMPSSCSGPQTTVLDVTSYPYPEPPGPEEEATASFDTPVGADGCDQVPFDPSIAVAGGGATDSPEPLTVDLGLPYSPDPEETANSHLRKAKVSLPSGLGLNPSGAVGLLACSDEQFAQGSDDPVACPPESRIGSVAVQTPALPPNSIGGSIYVAQPLSDDPSSGNQFRIFIHAASARYGVNVRLTGQVFPNPTTGRLTAVVDQNPEAPFSSFLLHFDGGPRAALTSPDTCGPHQTTTELTPYARPDDPASPSASYSLATTPGRGDCAPGLADRPFAPGHSAAPVATTAGAYSPFQLHVSRADGSQELRRVEAHLPPGLIARLKGVEYCPEASIAAASRRTGKAEIGAPSCPVSSFVGTVGIDAGSGSAPLHVAGNAYLAGPYEGAPVSIVFVTPAVAGPYDLGTVVVRTALRIDPRTTEVTAVSDPIPYVFGGVKLDVRRIDVSIDRKKFTVNPTTCREPFAVRSNILGGGADPANPATWTTSSQASWFQPTKCKALRFKPKFYAKVYGPRRELRHNGNPKLRAIFATRRGDANLRRAALILPKATILDQDHIDTICTRVQLAAHTCPKGSVYGHARAISPLLDRPLSGPVYLISSDTGLPDLLADLRGQVNVQLRGVISARNGRLKTVFPEAPDVAVRKFILKMRGGAKGLLVNSNDLCGRKRLGYLNLLAQNSRRMRDKRLWINIPGCRKNRKR